MKRIVLAGVVVAVLALASGCTRLPVEIESVRAVSFAADGVTTATVTTTTRVNVDYLTMLQDRNFSLDRPGWGKIEYSTKNDPVVQLAKTVSQLATEKAAGKP